MAFLYDYQEEAVEKLKNGSILCGGVGSGKSRTGIAYYYTKECGGTLDPFLPMSKPRDLYIITTARKRDTHEWEGDLSPFLLSTNKDISNQQVKIIVDSWNNIKKYRKVNGAFFIFDEQRVIGSGEWVKAFLDICRKNRWILLSATPGDTWSDYIPVFVANGFYKNRTEFKRRHIVMSPYTKFPKIERYLEEGRLNRLRREILVTMNFQRKTEAHYENVPVEFDKVLLKTVTSQRWDIYKDEPIQNASQYGFVVRRIVNSDESRGEAILSLCDQHPKVIIFYNFNYELDILKSLPYKEGTAIAEWNGHVHEPIPKTDIWVYLVNYGAGSEGWNCVETDTIIFYSLNHSYRTMIQASGRIDRLNTPYKDLYYYRLKSSSWIDTAIARAIARKKDFNIRAYY